jgi:hypothetical protein
MTKPIRDLIVASPVEPRANDDVVNVGSIRITLRTILIGSQVFQFQNVTGFGFSAVYDPPKPIPWTTVVVLGLIGFGFLVGVDNLIVKLLGLLLLGTAVLVYRNHVSQPPKEKRAALRIYLNSGYSRTVIARETFVEEVVEALYDFMERRDTTRVLNVSFERADIQNVQIGDQNQLQTRGQS